MFYYSNGLLVETHSLAHSVIYEELLMIVLSMMMKKYLLKKTQFKTRVISYLHQTGQTQYAIYDRKNILFEALHTHIEHMKVYPWDCLGLYRTFSILDICYGQLTPVKSRYPLTSIT